MSPKLPEPRFFTHYWANDTWEEGRRHGGRHPSNRDTLTHVAGSQFRSRGVQPGDFVYVVTNEGGQMLLGGRMRVARVCDLEQARGELDYEPWNAPDQVFGTDGTLMRYDRVVSQDVARRLRFGDGDSRLVFVGNRLEQQTLRGVRELVPESAGLLDDLLDHESSWTLELAKSEEEIAISLEVFRRGLGADRRLTEKLTRQATYWVHDPLSDVFGPAKFVGYRNMTFSRYAAGIARRTTGATFDGYVARNAIEHALGRTFVTDSRLAEALQMWIERTLPGALGDANPSKWKFLSLMDVSCLVPAEEVEAIIAHHEGRHRRTTVNVYERDPRARRQCIAHHGTRCAVCGFEFSERYGDIGRGYVHVHHLMMLSKAGGERRVDPINDLRPVCANCHAMLHQREPPFDIDELRRQLRPWSPVS